MPGKKITGLAASFDIETTGLEPAYARVLMCSIKPWGESATLLRADVASSDDSALVEEIISELSQYAILFAHNGVFFDRAFLNARALQYNLPLLDPKGLLFDPWRIAKRQLNMGRNSLDSLAQHLGLEEQKMHLPPSVWVRAGLDHDEDAMKLLGERCISDTNVLEELAERVLGLAGNITPWGSA